MSLLDSAGQKSVNDLRQTGLAWLDQITRIFFEISAKKKVKITIEIEDKEPR
jgi:ABC-type lipopolysaccharide export system ATPase subunit